MEELFLPFELCLELGKIGFDEECLAYWEDNKLAPSPKLIIHYSNQELVVPPDLKKIYDQRPEMFKVKNKNSTLPIWCFAAPTYDQILNWFFETYNLNINCRTIDFKSFKFDIKQQIKTPIAKMCRKFSPYLFPTKKLAMDEGINEAINFIVNPF